MAAKPFFQKVVLAVWIVSIGLVVYVSLLPRLELPLDFWNADKFYHALAYLWLGGLPLWAFRRGDRARVAAYAMIVLGVVLEWGQAYVPGRTPSVGDAVANAFGVFIGLWLSEILMNHCRGCAGLRD